MRMCVSVLDCLSVCVFKKSTLGNSCAHFVGSLEVYATILSKFLLI